MRRLLLFLGSALLGAASLTSVGCSSQLETGYSPKALGESSSVRRSYYAAPFSEDAMSAGQDNFQQFQSHRPGTY